MKIVVPVDSAEPFRIREIVAAYAVKLNADVQFLTVVSPRHVHGTFRADAGAMETRLQPGGDFSGGRIPGNSPAALSSLPGTTVESRDQALTRAHAEARDHLERLIAQVPAVRATAELVDGDHPAVTIVDFAREHGADLLVLQTHARAGIGRAVLGSVAEAVVRIVGVPVLLVGPAAATAAPVAD